jgi:ribosome maturation factor RimP
MPVRDEIINRTRQIAEPILSREGFELVDVHYGSDAGRWVLRLTIDRPGSRIGIDDCQRASEAVETALDVEELIDHAYSLEVSSPGVNRPLTRPEHFERCIGSTVRIRTVEPLFDPPRKNFLGELVSFQAEEAEVDVAGAGRFRIPFAKIAKANLEAE